MEMHERPCAGPIEPHGLPTVEPAELTAAAGQYEKRIATGRETNDEPAEQVAAHDAVDTQAPHIGSVGHHGDGPVVETRFAQLQERNPREKQSFAVALEIAGHFLSDGRKSQLAAEFFADGRARSPRIEDKPARTGGGSHLHDIFAVFDPAGHVEAAGRAAGGKRLHREQRAEKRQQPSCCEHSTPTTP